MAAAAPSAPLPGPAALAPRDIDASGWTSLAVGAALALLTQALPWLGMLVGYFSVLIHEMGHAAAGWLFGYPSIPAFDFSYGGGVTLHQDPSPLIVIGVLAALAWAGWMLRRNTAGLAAIAAVAALYVWARVTDGHQIIMIAMGHGSELLFAALFLYRALSGASCHTPAERPLYAWIGCFLLLRHWSFAHGLVTSLDERLMYEDAKGGGHWMDYSRLAEEYFRVSLPAVATVFLWLTPLPPLLAFSVHRWHARCADWAARLLEIPEVE